MSSQPTHHTITEHQLTKTTRTRDKREKARSVSHDNIGEMYGEFKKKTSSKRSWTAEEDRNLKTLVNLHGTSKWTSVASTLGCRSGKQCRERWHNHLNPYVKKGSWTLEEDKVIIRMQRELGNQWARITKCVPGRTDNAVKNRWHSAMRQRCSSDVGARTAASRRNSKTEDENDNEDSEDEEVEEYSDEDNREFEFNKDTSTRKPSLVRKVSTACSSSSSSEPSSSQSTSTSSSKSPSPTFGAGFNSGFNNTDTDTSYAPTGHMKIPTHLLLVNTNMSNNHVDKSGNVIHTNASVLGVVSNDNSPKTCYNSMMPMPMPSPSPKNKRDAPSMSTMSSSLSMVSSGSGQSLSNLGSFGTNILRTSSCDNHNNSSNSPLGNSPRSNASTSDGNKMKSITQLKSKEVYNAFTSLNVSTPGQKTSKTSLLNNTPNTAILLNGNSVNGVWDSRNMLTHSPTLFLLTGGGGEDRLTPLGEPSLHEWFAEMEDGMNLGVHSGAKNYANRGGGVGDVLNSVNLTDKFESNHSSNGNDDNVDGEEKDNVKCNSTEEERRSYDDLENSLELNELGDLSIDELGNLSIDSSPAAKRVRSRSPWMCV